MYKTEQETFWAGEFGDEYITRNQGKEILAGNLHLFSRIMEKTQGVRTLIEFGANIGNNLQALHLLLPNTELAGIEINQNAAAVLQQKHFKAYPVSILDFNPDYTRDLVLIKGVLIHINPDELASVYDKLYSSTHRYIVVAEYYNPTPLALPYRGHANRLFKRDFAGELMDVYKDVQLVDYGFTYRRDNNFPQDDITWFLLGKK